MRFSSPPPIDGCAWLTENTLRWLYYAAIIVFVTIILMLMLVRTGKMYRLSGISALTFVLLRDQVIFYLLTFAASLANVVGVDSSFQTSIDRRFRRSLLLNLARAMKPS